MGNPYERIKELEHELSTTKYNKRSQHHIGLLKARIARLKEATRKKSEAKTLGIKKSGDATVVVIGFPSAGKSTLLNALTNASSPVAEYPFTTLDAIPGLMHYSNAEIQILDLPGIIEGATDGRGMGRKILSYCKIADLMIILLDATNPDQLKIINRELYDGGIRLNQKRPDISIKKKAKGGIDVGYTVKLRLNPETVKAILHEYRIFNADVVFKVDATTEQLIDAINGNRKYLPGIVALNKIDLLEEEKLQELKDCIRPDVCISSLNITGLDELKRLMFERLRLVKVFCKEAGKKADLDEPMILHESAVLRDMCLKLHKDFIKNFRFARMWRKKEHPRKITKLDYRLEDGDIVELHLR